MDLNSIFSQFTKMQDKIGYWSKDIFVFLNIDLSYTNYRIILNAFKMPTETEKTMWIKCSTQDTAEFKQKINRDFDLGARILKVAVNSQINFPLTYRDIKVMKKRIPVSQYPEQNPQDFIIKKVIRLYGL